MKVTHRIALLGSAITATTVLLASPAQATCSYAGGDFTCATTVTTNTSFVGPYVAPVNDRNYVFPSASATSNGFLIVAAGANVTGYGLALSAAGPLGPIVSFFNNGSVQIDVGNTATAGGSAAVNVNGAGTVNVNYSGNGSVTNLGTGGSGLEFGLTGGGNLNATVGGNVTSAVGGSGVFANAATATGGNINLTTLVGTTVRADFVGVYAFDGAAANPGSITVTNNSTVGSLVATPNTLANGVYGTTAGTGAVAVTNNGAIGSATDRIQLVGVGSTINNAGSTANVSLTGTGAVFTGPSTLGGLFANNTGSGTTTVTYSGAVNTTSGSGILANSTIGIDTVNANGTITSVGGSAIRTTTTTGRTDINVGANVSGTGGSGVDGITANSTSGAINVNVAGGNVTGTDDGIQATTSGLTTVGVSTGRTISAAYGVNVAGSGAGIVNNAGTITGTNASVYSALVTNGVTVNNNTGGVLNGNLNLSNGVDTLNNSGTFNAAA